MSIPQHVAIIMDGNGRYAVNAGQQRTEGHKAGLHAVRASIQFCLQNQIPYLSLFAFSSENWARPKDEVEFLMSLFVSALAEELQALIRQNVRLYFTGDRTELSQNLQQAMQAAEAQSEHCSKLHLNIVMNYGGRWEILDAVKSIAKDIQTGSVSEAHLDESLFSSYLSTSKFPAPDLFIRTGGEKRISNFFLWSLAYTELYFCDCLWPEFNEKIFQAAIDDYSSRERRFGHTSAQLVKE